MSAISRLTLPIVFVLAVYGNPTLAATVLEYRMTESGSSLTQSLEISNGRAWIRKLSGEVNADLIFDAESGQWALIRHDQRSIMIFSEKSVRQLSNQIEMIAPFVKGVGTQMNGLPPEQKQLWGHLLEKVPVDAINKLQQGARKAKVIATPKPKTIDGIPCHHFRIEAAPQKAELCLADPSDLPLPDEDGKTLARMSESGRGMLNALTSLSSALGFDLATNDIAKMSGVPLAFHEGDSKHVRNLAFLGARSAEKPLKAPDIPADYRREKFKPW